MNRSCIALIPLSALKRCIKQEHSINLCFLNEEDYERTGRTQHHDRYECHWWKSYLTVEREKLKNDGFNAGANCLENGSQNPSLSPSHRKMCSDYIDEKILELNQLVNKFDQYEKKDVPVKALIQERKQK